MSADSHLINMHTKNATLKRITVIKKKISGKDGPLPLQEDKKLNPKCSTGGAKLFVSNLFRRLRLGLKHLVNVTDESGR